MAAGVCRWALSEVEAYKQRLHFVCSSYDICCSDEPIGAGAIAVRPAPSAATALERTPEFNTPAHWAHRIDAMQTERWISSIQTQQRLEPSQSERRLSASQTEQRLSASQTERRRSASQTERRLTASQTERRLSASDSRALLLDASRRKLSERAEQLRTRMAEENRSRRELCQQVLAGWRRRTRASVASFALERRRAGMARWRHAVDRCLIRRLARAGTRLLRRWKAVWRVARQREALDVQLRMAAEFARASTQNQRGREYLQRWWLAGARADRARTQLERAERFACGSALMHTLAVRRLSTPPAPLTRPGLTFRAPNLCSDCSRSSGSIRRRTVSTHGPSNASASVTRGRGRRRSARGASRCSARPRAAGGVRYVHAV